MAKKNPAPLNRHVDLYDLLEVSPRARGDVINAAHRALAKIYDPDRGGDINIAKRLHEARAILTDPKERARYDAERNQLQGVVLGNYRVLEEIAEGGFGKTYRGEHIITRQPVCIKDCSQVAPQDAHVLLEEASAVWDLRHFSLPAMRDVLQLEDGSLALVMSYIPGPTLEQIVEKAGRLDPEHVGWITERILNVLHYLFFHGVVHGDIKPQNIIIQPETHTVVLVDFGLAGVKPTSATGAKGYTPIFAAPEQIDGAPLTPETDLYSLGMTMIYAAGGGTECVQRKNVPADVPEALCSFIRRLIVRHPGSRPRWEDENLHETIQEVRRQAFGRNRSQMKPIPGI